MFFVRAKEFKELKAEVEAIRDELTGPKMLGWTFKNYKQESLMGRVKRLVKLVRDGNRSVNLLYDELGYDIDNSFRLVREVQEPEKMQTGKLHEEGLKKIEYIAKNREKILEAFIAETGFLPSECVIIEKGNKWWVEKKEEQP